MVRNLMWNILKTCIRHTGCWGIQLKRTRNFNLGVCTESVLKPKEWIDMEQNRTKNFPFY